MPTGPAVEGGLRAVYLAPDDIIQQKVQSGDPYGDPDWREPILPPTAGFLQVSGPAVVTSLRQTDAGLELRLFNPDAMAGRAAVKLGDWPGATPTQAQPVNFEGQPVGQAYPLRRWRVVAEVGREKIVTLRLV